MMKRTLSESLFRSPARALSVAATLALAFSAGCVSKAGRESGAESATKATAAVKADAADVRPVRVSSEGQKAAEPSVAAAEGGAVYVAWVGHGEGKEADVWLLDLD